MTKYDIVSFIKQERKKQKLSQKELADKAGIKRYQQVTEIEKGVVDFGVGVLIKVVNALGYCPRFDIKDEIPNNPLFDFSNVESIIQEPKKETIYLPFKRIKT